MALPVINHLGWVNGAGDTQALFLKKFGGEVLTAYERKLKILNAVTHKYATNGKSAQFPATGLAVAQHYIAGDSLYLDTQTGGASRYIQKINANEIEIFCDRPLIAGPVAVDNWEDMVNHYDVRAPYAAQLAQAIGKVMDQRALVAGILGARQENATVTGLPRGMSNLLADGTAKVSPNGSASPSAALLTDGAAILAELFAVAVAFDLNDIPDEGRFAAVDPTQYSALVQNATLLNRDFAGGISNGEFAGNKVYTAAGFTLIKTNSYPRTNMAAVVGANQSGGYALDAVESAFLCFHSSAIGVVTWREMVMQADLDNMEYQSNLVLAKLSAGIKWLRPEALYEATTI